MEYSEIYSIIVAAGKGLRVGSPIPKQLLSYGGATILEHTMTVFCTHDKVGTLIVVEPSDGSLHERYEEIASRLRGRYEGKEIYLVRGGAERGDSVYAGLELARALSVQKDNDPNAACVMIHDAARPGVSHEIIDRNLDAIREHQGVVTAVQSTDSVRLAQPNSELNNNIHSHIIKGTAAIDRRLVYSVQTPQTFGLADIIKAYDKAHEEGYIGTDDASVASNAGIDVAIVEGSYDNIKITTARDVPMTTRVGTGFDVHQLVSERSLILCGTPVPYELGLLGHSDADVATHAIMDALLGAAGKGDIGIHFPDSDDKYKGISSLKLLEEVKEIIGDYQINNIDVTIIAQRPKLAPYRELMAKNIADTLGIPVAAVNVKATTTEGLGFTGRGEGIAALATCAIEGRM